MTPDQVLRIVQLVEDAGIGWWLASDREARVEQLVSETAKMEEQLRSRLGRPISPPLLDQMLQDPAAMKPLIQSFGAPMTIQARTLVYCIVAGASIERVSFEYRLRTEARLEVLLRLPGGSESLFESDDIWDFEVLRHLGMAKLSGRPLLHGYYPFRQT